MRNLSCAITTDQVIARTKTVTRRLGTFWTCLEVGDKLCLVRKSQGLRQGEHVERLAVVEVVSVRAEPLDRIYCYGVDELTQEGFPDMCWRDFERMFLRMHKCAANPLITRIEWRYLDDGTEGDPQLARANADLLAPDGVWVEFDGLQRKARILHGTKWWYEMQLWPAGPTWRYERLIANYVALRLIEARWCAWLWEHCHIVVERTRGGAWEVWRRVDCAPRQHDFTLMDAVPYPSKLSAIIAALKAVGKEARDD